MKLSFDAKGYLFQEKLNALRSGFETASKTLSKELDDVRTAATQYRQSMENGGDWIGERDDDGSILWDQENLLEMQEDAAHDTLLAFRKAYVITAYHHWERGMQSWTKSNSSAGFSDLLKKAEDRGLIVHERLELVRDLANTLKHNKKSAGQRLLSKWPDLFRPGLQPDKVRDWYEAMNLEDADVYEVFDIVARSGPRARPE